VREAEGLEPLEEEGRVAVEAGDGGDGVPAELQRA
jgi:hypothetical protein